MPYAVADDAASLAGLTAGDVTAAHATLADVLVDSLMNREPNGFNSVTETDEEYNIPIDGTRKLLLNHHPIISITTVKVDFQSSSPTTLDSTNYIESNGIVRLVTPPTNTASIEWVSSFPKGTGNVAVTYVHGFASVPAMIIQMANIIAGQLGKAAVQEASRPTSGATRIRIGDFEEAYGNNPTAIVNMLTGAQEVLVRQAIAIYREWRF